MLGSRPSPIHSIPVRFRERCAAVVPTAINRGVAGKPPLAWQKNGIYCMHIHYIV